MFLTGGTSMLKKRNKSDKREPKSVDRCAVKLISLLDTGDYTYRLSPEQRRTVREEISTYLDQVGADTFTVALHKLYALAARQVQRRTGTLRGKR